MIVDRLRMSGFKSFVDTTELQIEPGLTGIVGPNGCGKSNVLESLRWVMGATSAKALRGAGMEDVIRPTVITIQSDEFVKEASMLPILIVA